ncbi:MAG: L-seryl-tRNA(Sec) selenium transferase [Candidatus Zixiibacteriota bacterium]
MPSDQGTFDSLRDFPAVEIAAGYPEFAPYITRLTRPLVIETIKRVIDDLKTGFREKNKACGREILVREIIRELRRLDSLNLTPVLNGTGIVIHTNLGRSPLSPEIVKQAIPMLSGYSNLEFNVLNGNRGKRGILVEKLLATLCETESGTIVNNNAAALFIILNTLANRKEVIISRGELVQIGGGFKIPEIMARAGAKLVEVGTTNRTSIDDYRAAITDRTRMILKVHRSNFVQKGFVAEAPIREIADLCREHRIISVNDLGSGLLSFPSGIHITEEPDIRESVRGGADLTCFSGDKLLGSAQAGLIAGKSDLIAKIKKNPLFRAIRCDKIVFSITTQVLASYLNGTQNDDIPIWKAIMLPVTKLKLRGEKILSAVGKKDIILRATQAMLGGGTTPDKTIPSLALSIRPTMQPNALAKKFREYDPPIIGRVEDEVFYIDLRTIPEEFDDIIISAINELVK